MVARTIEVRDGVIDNLRLPQALAEGALLLMGLDSRGTLAEAARRVQIERQGGFCGVDALVYLVLYFSSMPHDGLRALWGAIGEASPRLGALAGRSSVMSPSALSRLLGVVEEAEVDQFARWLLLEASGVMDVMRAEAAQVRDAQGTVRRVFAFDPVRIAIRHRGLPQDEKLPPPKRRTGRLGAPGRAGRKRGEVVCSAGVLEDLGTGAVLDVQVNPGNGDGRAMLERAIRTVLATLSSLEEPVSSAILLADGEFGRVPHLSMCAESGLSIITRSSRYELLDDPVIWARLRDARWDRVEDSKSGPVRYAADLGTVRIPPGVRTRRDDGRRYGPVEARLVVSRYADERERGCGRLIDGARYELFVSIGVSPSSFPAADVVAMFYARCGQECSFQQHERELGIQRVFSTNPAGQLFAWVAALFVWNLRLAAGIQLSPPLPPRSAQSPRQNAPGIPPAWPTHLQAERASEPPNGGSPSEPAGQDPDPEEPLAAALARINWSHLLRGRQGWSWDHAQRGLLTAERLLLRFHRVEWIAHRAKLRFLSADHQRQATLAVPPHLARAITAALRHESPSERDGAAPAQREDERDEQDAVPASHAASTWLIASAIDDQQAPYSIGWPHLLRARARKVLSELAATVDIKVRMGRAPPARTSHPLVEPLRHRRQHRRLTWEERLARHAARQNCAVRITTSSHGLASWLRTPPSDVPPARATM